MTAGGWRGQLSTYTLRPPCKPQSECARLRLPQVLIKLHSDVIGAMTDPATQPGTITKSPKALFYKHRTHTCIQVLIKLHSDVIGAMTDPALLADFLTARYARMRLDYSARVKAPRPLKR